MALKPPVFQAETDTPSRPDGRVTGGPRIFLRRAAPRWIRTICCVWCGTVAASDVGVTEMFPVNYPRNIAGTSFYEGMLYAITTNNILLKYDPTTGALLEVVDPLIPNLAFPHTHGMTPGSGGTFWVAEIESSARIYQVRYSDYAILSWVIRPPGGPTYGLGFDQGFLWVGHHSSGPPTSVQALQPSTGEIVRSFEFGGIDIHGLAWVEGYLWALDNAVDAVYQVTCAGQVRSMFTLPPGLYGSLAFDGAHFWTNNQIMFLRIDLPPPLVAGDFDGDGLVDQGDYTPFALCVNRPMSPECSQGDFDRDCDVDCRDWDQFVLACTGIGCPPALPACARTIPTLSAWGLAAMALLLAAAAFGIMNRRPAAAVDTAPRSPLPGGSGGGGPPQDFERMR